jgi:hypothetical protein
MTPSRRLTGFALAAVAIAAIAVSIYLAFAEQKDANTGASTYSRSAIGHAGLLALLQSQGIPASASRGGSLRKVRAGGLLVLAEPDFSLSSGTLVKNLLRAHDVLLVLPKWLGSDDEDSKGWIELAVPKPIDVPAGVLDDALDGDSVQRKNDFTPTLNLLGPAPHVHTPAQLIMSRQLLPELDENGAMLIGSLRRAQGTLWVLSDPDIISNHGLANGNADLAVALFQKARHGEPVVFDETIHGFSNVPTGQMHLLVARPFAAATVEMLLACALLVWAGFQGFGDPLPRPAPLQSGKQALIANIADLLVFAGHQGDVLRRYALVSVEDAAARLHAPDVSDGPARAAFLAQTEAQRGMILNAASLLAEARGLGSARRPGPAAIFALANQIYCWKQEILRGSTGLGRHSGLDTRRNPQGGGGPGRGDRAAAGEPAGGRARAA